MIAKKTKKWLDLLPKITASYNDSFHRSIGMKPNDVTKNKEAEIWNRLYMPKPRKLKAPKTNESSTSREKPFTYSIGDTVKVTTDTHKFSKGYNKRWSDENFQIAGRDIKQGKEVYSVKDLENDLIKGSWYPQELQRVTIQEDESYEIEKVLRTRYRLGKKEYLVHWVGWDKKFDSWIDAETIENYK